MAVGMKRALDSAIGLPSSWTSASEMLGLLMPEEVRRSFMKPFLQGVLLKLHQEPDLVAFGVREPSVP
jgi:hypothetical protein